MNGPNWQATQQNWPYSSMHQGNRKPLELMQVAGPESAVAYGRQTLMPGDRVAVFDANEAVMYDVTMYQNGNVGVEAYDLVRRQTQDPAQRDIQSLQAQVTGLADQMADMKKMLEGLV